MAKYEDLVDIVRGEIRSGNFNNRFPSNRELAKRFGVAYVTANKVVNSLVDEGLLYREHGRGTFLAQTANTPAIDVDHETETAFFGLVHRAGQITGQDSFLGQIISGIHKVLDRQGAALQVFPLDRDHLEEWEHDFKRLSGLLILDEATSDKDIAWLKLHNIPAIIFGPDMTEHGLSSIDIDNVGGAHQALSHLLNQGFSKPAIVDLSTPYWYIDERRQGFNQAMEGRTTTAIKEFALSSWDHAAAKSAWADLAPHLDDIDCIITPSPMMAVECISQIKAGGLQPGKDIGFILYGNFNDTSIPPTPFPTCISMPFDRMAEMATTLLTMSVKAKYENRALPTQRRLTPPMMRIGHTCGAIRWWEQ